MLSSLVNVSTLTSSPSSSYESSSSWCKLNSTANSLALSSTTSCSSSQNASPINTIEKATNSVISNYEFHSNGFTAHEHFQPLKILIFAESFPSYTSGITRRFKEIVRRLAENGHHIHIITGCNDARSWTEGNEAWKRSVSFSIRLSSDFTNKIDCAYPFLVPLPTIYLTIRQFSPDVIHIVEQTPAALICGAFAKSLNIPIIWSSHTNIDFYLSRFIRPGFVNLTKNVYQFIRSTHLSYSSKNLTVSKDFAAFMEKAGVPRPVIVWKTGVDSELFNPSRRSKSMRYRLFGTYNNFTEEQMDSITLFVCVGRISPEKNFEFLSHVLQRIRSQTFLCIIGDGPYRNTLEPKFSKEHVHFIGYLGGKEIAEAYASADYFIYASISETFGQVYLEAMASGTPVIAAEGGQLKEFFVNGEHGYLWKPDDLDSAEKAVRRAMQNREYLSTKAREQALQYSWDSASEQLETIYYDAVEKHEKKERATILSKLKHSWHLLYYFLVWLICNLLALFLMAPFVQVSPPQFTPS